MTATDIGFAAIAAVLLAAIAWSDARRTMIEPWAGAALVVTGMAWHATTPSDIGMVSSAWWMPVLGLVCGAAVVAIPIAAADLRRRPWPLMPGDGVLLAGIGALVGPLGLAWSLLAGSALALAMRVCVQTRRGRPVRSGYLPLAPGMAGGTLIVLGLLAGGHAVAQEAGDVLTTGEGQVLSAVVLAPEVDPGPPGADEHMTALAATEPLTLAEAAARLAALTLLAVEVEDRPSRTGIALSLAAPPPRRFDLEGSLVEIVDRLAALYGYRWEWRGNAIVFYRYWDEEFALSTRPVPELRQARWVIDTDRDATLAEVLERWAGEAGWSLVWSASTDFRPGADAVFDGSFLGAVDALLADPATASTLTATAYRANRRLVIEEVH